ncbi:MAG: Gfo/Idh/MocA family oxidoreductase [Armatimonadetes bacterium]|nr:Gfo/Idh/MocA family oxidoreductase [Armatimonadota bacterium]
MQPVRIGIIGAGAIVKARHLPGLARIEGVEVRAVANRSRESAEAVAREWNIPTVLSDWRELLKMEELDAVLIGTNPHLHAEATIAALEAGKHVFCQARMARNYVEARAMYEAARRSDKVTMLCPPPHGMKGDFVMKRLIGEGYLGRLYDVHATGLSPMYADPGQPIHWRQRPEISGCNTLTLGMWAEVIHRWIGYARSLSAQIKVQIPERPDPEAGQPAPVGLPDTVGIVAEMDCGALAIFHFSGLCRFAPDNRIELFGSEGTLLYNLDRDIILGGKADQPSAQAIPIPSEMEREWMVEADFIAAIREGKPVSPDFYEGLKYMEFTEAVFRSAESGQKVGLPL